jgi:integrase/recombinase XerD
MSAPDVTIFVRHSAECKHKSKGEFYKQCDCRKHLRWSSNGTQFRQAAKTRSWKQAEKEKKAVELKFDSDVTPKQAADAAEPAGRKTLAQAITTFTTGKANQEIDTKVLESHIRELKRLEDFMSKKGRFFPAEITLDDLEAFRATWKSYGDSSLTRRVYQTRLNEFLTYCYHDRMIDRVPKLKPINAEEPPTLPLVDDQYETLLRAIPAAFPADYNEPREGGPGRPRALRPPAATVRAVIQLMRYSGWR